MNYTTLKNRVFENYYFNSYLPGTIGGYESSAIFNYLLSLENISKNLKDETNITKIWIDDQPTWYTKLLPKLFFIPKFSDESEKKYLERLFLLINTQQDESTIVDSIYSLLKDSISVKNDIQVIDKLDTTSAVWSDQDEETLDNWDGTKVWSSEFEVSRTLFLVNISFIYRGSNLDATTWDYWILPKNYTKIEDMVKLYKPPGSTFELRLNIPEDFEQTIGIFSNTLLQWEGIHVVSDTTIAAP